MKQYLTHVLCNEGSDIMKTCPVMNEVTRKKGHVTRDIGCNVERDAILKRLWYHVMRDMISREVSQDE